MAEKKRGRKTKVGTDGWPLRIKTRNEWKKKGWTPQNNPVETVKATNENNTNQPKTNPLEANKANDNSLFGENNGEINNSPPVANIPNESYDPLTSEPVAEKSYAKPLADMGSMDTAKDIPEPILNPPKIDINATPPKPPLSASPANPAMNDLPPQEKELAAESMAKMAIMGYEKLHSLGRWYIKVSDEQKNEWHASGKIPLYTPIDFGDGRKITWGQFLNQFNKDIDSEFTVSNEFKKQVEPILVRIFLKYGWGLTDEQLLMVIVGEDLITKVAILRGMKAQLNSMVELMMKAVGGSSQSQSYQQAPPPPRQQPKQEQQVNDEIVDAEILPNDILEREEK
jgi:hypothetical protein